MTSCWDSLLSLSQDSVLDPNQGFILICFDITKRLIFHPAPLNEGWESTLEEL